MLRIRLDVFQIRLRPTEKKSDPDPTLEKKPDPDPTLEKTGSEFFLILHNTIYLILFSFDIKVKINYILILQDTFKKYQF